MERYQDSVNTLILRLVKNWIASSKEIYFPLYEDRLGKLVSLPTPVNIDARHDFIRSSN